MYEGSLDFFSLVFSETRALFSSIIGAGWESSSGDVPVAKGGNLDLFRYKLDKFCGTLYEIYIKITIRIGLEHGVVCMELADKTFKKISIWSTTFLSLVGRLMNELHSRCIPQVFITK